MMNMIPALIVYSIMIVIIIAAVYFVSKVGLQIKLGYWLLGGYSIFLIGAVILYTLIPTENLPSESELAGEELPTDIRHQIAYRGVEIESLEDYKVEEWDFDIDLEETLELQVELDYHYIPVLIKEVEGQEDISITLYYDKPTFDLEAVIGDTDVVDITMNGSEMRVNARLQNLYEFAHITKEFPFTQFSEEAGMGHYMPMMYTGELVLYVEKPAALQMNITPNTDYEYIN